MKLLCALLLLTQSVKAVKIGEFDYSQQELEKMSQALSNYTDLANRSLENHSAELIPELGNGLLKTGMTGIYVVGDREGVHEKLQQALLSTPGHAEYYRDLINEARRNVEDAGGDLSIAAHHRSNLTSAIRYKFPIFEQLPSYETVRVLGEFLFDERGYVRIENPKTEYDLIKMIEQGPVFGRAAEALLKLPLEQKPVANTRYPNYVNPEDVLPWRRWFEEIKSGKRTFRFVGDSTEYDLNGPAPQEKLVRIDRDRRRDEERTAGLKKPSAGQEAGTALSPIAKPSVIAGLMAALAVCMAAVWYFLRGRKVVRQ